MGTLQDFNGVRRCCRDTFSSKRLVAFDLQTRAGLPFFQSVLQFLFLSYSPRIFQIAYLNRDTFFTSVSSFKENLTGFFPRNLPVVKISPEWVTGPEQGKSSGRIDTFNLWTGMFRDGISFIPDETVIPLRVGIPRSNVGLHLQGRSKPI